MGLPLRYMCLLTLMLHFSIALEATGDESPDKDIRRRSLRKKSGGLADALAPVAPADHPRSEWAAASEVHGRVLPADGGAPGAGVKPSKSRSPTPSATKAKSSQSPSKAPSKSPVPPPNTGEDDDGQAPPNGPGSAIDPTPTSAASTSKAAKSTPPPPAASSTGTATAKASKKPRSTPTPSGTPSGTPISASKVSKAPVAAQSDDPTDDDPPGGDQGGEPTATGTSSLLPTATSTRTSTPSSTTSILAESSATATSTKTPKVKKPKNNTTATATATSSASSSPSNTPAQQPDEGDDPTGGDDDETPPPLPSPSPLNVTQPGEEGSEDGEDEDEEKASPSAVPVSPSALPNNSSAPDPYPGDEEDDAMLPSPPPQGNDQGSKGDEHAAPLPSPSSSPSPKAKAPAPAPQSSGGLLEMTGLDPLFVACVSVTLLVIAVIVVPRHVNFRAIAGRLRGGPGGQQYNRVATQADGAGSSGGRAVEVHVTEADDEVDSEDEMRALRPKPTTHSPGAGGDGPAPKKGAMKLGGRVLRAGSDQRGEAPKRAGSPSASRPAAAVSNPMKDEQAASGEGWEAELEGLEDELDGWNAAGEAKPKAQRAGSKGRSVSPAKKGGPRPGRDAEEDGWDDDF